MSIGLSGQGWRCWRRPTDHVGKNPSKLVAALSGVSYEQARHITGTSTYVPEDFMDQVRGRLDPKPVLRPTKFKKPKEWKPFQDTPVLPSQRRFNTYLLDRGFTQQQIGRMTRRYDLHYATQGDCKDRIIFPVYYYDKLVAYTARSIHPTATLRYKTPTADPEKAKELNQPCAVGPVTDYLLWFDDLLEVDADTICLVEGPFDALKVNTLGRKEGIAATCFFTAEPSVSQVNSLYEVLPRFRNRLIVLDRGTLTGQLRTLAQLPGLRLQVVTLPKAIKDPGELDRVSFQQIFLDRR